MKASDYIARFLFRRGVRQVFELSGGMITHLLDSLHTAGEIRIVSVHHEQTASFAADAVGRMTGVPGVAMATSGPGATNLLTGIGSCYFDSSPAVFITGQVNRNEQKGARSIRQLGFQETDIVSMAGPITKAAWSVDSPERLPEILADAFRLAVSGRPGPVLVDIPMDVQRANITAQFSVEDPPAQSRTRQGVGEEVARALISARRPMILAGGGVRASRSADAFRELIDCCPIPVVHSLMAVDLLPAQHPCRVGMIGTYGNRWANLALMRSEVLLVVGSRLDIRQTGSRTDAFKGDRTIFHVDCEAGEINNRVIGCRSIVAELSDFLPDLASALSSLKSAGVAADRSPWLSEIDSLREQWPETAELANCRGINPNTFVHQLSRGSRDAAVYVADVGQHQMWAAQSLELEPQQRFLTSGGMGSMGFSLPASIGAALSVSGQPVVVIAGDGGFQCNIQELETIAHLKLPVKVVVMNNRCHGMVRQFQESYFDARYQSTYWGYSAPNFANIATAYGICAHTISNPDEVEGALRWLWEDASRPQLLQVMIDTLCNVYPKIAFGQPMSEMEPLAQPLEIEST